MDFTNTCRGCMRSDQTLYPLFFDNISDIFMTCTELKILENDKLPQNICLTCIRHLEASHQFKLQCQTSEATFISYLTDNSNSSTKPLMPMTDVKPEPNCDVSDVESEPGYDVPIVKLEPSWDITNVELEPSYDVTVVKSEPSCDVSDVEPEPDSESEHENPISLMLSNNDDSSNNSSKSDNIYNIETAALIKPKECSKCKKQFPYLSSLKRHISTCNKSSDKIISCGLCDFECDRENKLTLHLEGHMKDKILSCKNCDYTGVDLADYLCHRYVHQTTDYGKRLHCWRCGSKFLNVDRLEFHIRSKYLNKLPGLCKVCLKGFGSMRYFRTHKCMEAGIEPYRKCDECGKSCLTKRSFTRHMNSHTIKKYVCDACEMGFRSKPELINHQYRIHDTEQPLLCKHCGKLFNTKRALHRHVVRIDNKKRFNCTACGKIFSLKSNLRAHMDIHTGKRPFQCEHCNKSYKTRAHLVIHIRTHTGERPYECDACDNAFPSSSALIRHKMLHSEVRVKYPCTICGRVFLENSKLKMHMSSHESVIDELQNELSDSN